ncbi:MAG: 2-hydroxyacid dehydrogenase [Bacteroidota bacterium]
MQRVVSTREIPSEGLQSLRERFNVSIQPPPTSAGHSEESLIEAATGADALITMLSDPVSARVIHSLDRLKIISQYAVGYDNIDLEAARETGLVVTHTPGVLTEATADFAMGLLLAVARRIPAADRYVRDGRFKRWETMELLGLELSGRTLGIVGMGRIGAAVARRAIGFGMEIIYHNRHRANPTIERQLAARFVSFDELLSESDVISIHASLGAENRSLFDAQAFARMKPGAILINTARGAIVREVDLVDALKGGHLGGAGMDVFEQEPVVHPDLMDLPNVVLAPHIGSATRRARSRMSEMCATSITRYFLGDDTIPYRIV